MRMLYVNKKSGRLADSLIIKIDDEILINNTDYFNPNDETHLNLLYNRFMQRKRKYNLVIYGLYFQKQTSDETAGLFWAEYIPPSLSQDEFKKQIKEVLEYKNF